MTKTVYFNTGVRPAPRDPYTNEPPITPYGCQVVRGGVIQIPMTVEDLPDSAEFLYAQSHLPETLPPNVIYRELLDGARPGAIYSKYAFFRIKE